MFAINGIGITIFPYDKKINHYFKPYIKLIQMDH